MLQKSFVFCNTLIRLLLVPHPVYTTPWKMSHGANTSNILGSPMQSRLHNLIQQLLMASIQGLPATCLFLVDLLKFRRFLNPCILHDSKARSAWTELPAWPIQAALRHSTPKKLIQSPFNLASGGFLEQGQKSATFFPNILQEWSLGQFLIVFSSEIS